MFGNLSFILMFKDLWFQMAPIFLSVWNVWLWFPTEFSRYSRSSSATSSAGLKDERRFKTQAALW